jgi:tRNA nucleotidyltransferase (CCA-adding enzyme)
MSERPSRGKRARPRLASPPFEFPEEVRRIAKKLQGGGFQAYVAGGAVRDLLLGRPAADWDVATDARPEEVQRLFGRVVPTGIRHGTVTLVRGGDNYEVTTYRTGRQGRYSRSLEKDLAYRDFTFNAMACDPLENRLVDPFGGAADLRRGVVRAVGSADGRFAEDPLRIFRAVRFAAVFRFRLEAETAASIPGHLEAFRKVAPERVREELFRLLLAPRPSEGLDLMRRTGLMAEVIPELLEGWRRRQNHYHKYTIYRHIMVCVDASPPELDLRLAALLHDVAKPRVRQKIDGIFRFHNHEQASARLARKILHRLRCSRARVERVTHLIKQHMFHYQSGWKNAAVRRLVRRVGLEHLDDLFALRRADVAAHGVPSDDLELLEELGGRIRRLVSEKPPLGVGDLQVSGRDVMQVTGLHQGAEVGRLLERLLQEALEDPRTNQRDRQLARLRQWQGGNGE